MFRWLTNAFKASGTAIIKVGALFGMLEVKAPARTEDYLLQYLDEPWIYASVWVTANTCARVPYHLRNRKTDEIITEHALLDLFRQPNADQSYFDFMEGTITYLDLGGEVFWEKVFNKLGTPKELWVLRPDRVEIKPREDGRGIEQYTYKVNSGADGTDFTPEEIVPMKYFHPLDDWRGLSAIHPLVNNLIEEGHATNWRKRFLKRYGTPEGALHTEQHIGETEATRVGAAWQHGWAEGKGTPLLTKGLSWQDISQPPKSSGLLDLLKIMREEKLAVTGVPPVKVGLLEFAKYANYDLQSRAFYIDTITPKMEKVAGAINRYLLPHYPGSEDLDFEFDTFAVTYADLSSLVETLALLFDRAALTPNDMIALTGLGKKYPDGNKHYTKKLEPTDEEADGNIEAEPEPEDEDEGLGDSLEV